MIVVISLASSKEPANSTEKPTLNLIFLGFHFWVHSIWIVSNVCTCKIEELRRGWHWLHFGQRVYQFELLGQFHLRQVEVLRVLRFGTYFKGIIVAQEVQSRFVTLSVFEKHLLRYFLFRQHRVRIKHHVKYIVELHLLWSQRNSACWFLFLNLSNFDSFHLIFIWKVFCHAFAMGEFDFIENNIVELIHHWGNFGALESILTDKFNCLFNLVDASLQNHHSLSCPLRLELLNVMQCTVVINVDLLVLFLEFILQQDHWVKRRAWSVRWRTRYINFLLDIY